MGNGIKYSDFIKARNNVTVSLADGANPTFSSSALYDIEGCKAPFLLAMANQTSTTGIGIS